MEIKPAIVDGIVSVANWKLRVEGVESYKKYLSEEYYFKKDLDKATRNERERILNRIDGIIASDKERCGEANTFTCINILIDELKSLSAFDTSAKTEDAA